MLDVVRKKVQILVCEGKKMKNIKVWAMSP